MGRDMPFRCPHGNLLGGDESFGHADDRCEECEWEQKYTLDRKTDLTMFAGYHLGWIVQHGGTVPQVSYDEIHEMINEYTGTIRPKKESDDGDT